MIILHVTELGWYAVVPMIQTINVPMAVSR